MMDATSQPSQSDAPQYERSGSSLKALILGMSVLVVVLGLAGYYRLVQSEKAIQAALQTMGERGKTLDTEGCITAALQWHGACEANRPMCDEELDRVLTHCLASQDRSSSCESLGEDAGTSQWVFQTCESRGTPCKVRGKQCPCSTAYRTLDSFCHYHQRGISL